MKRTFSKKTRTAVTITAVLLFIVLTGIWVFLAVLQVRSVTTRNFDAYSRTQVIRRTENPSSWTPAEGDGVYTSVYYNDGAWICGNLLSSYTAEDLFTQFFAKTVFLDIDTLPEAEIENFLAYCLQKAPSRFAFFSADYKKLERCCVLSKKCLYFCIAQTPFRSFVVTKTGYNLAAPLTALSQTAVTRAHENDHLTCAFLPAAQDFSAAKDLLIDYVIY